MAVWGVGMYMVYEKIDKNWGICDQFVLSTKLCSWKRERARHCGVYFLNVCVTDELIIHHIPPPLFAYT